MLLGPGLFQSSVMNRDPAVQKQVQKVSIVQSYATGELCTYQSATMSFSAQLRLFPLLAAACT